MKLIDQRHIHRRGGGLGERVPGKTARRAKPSLIPTLHGPAHLEDSDGSYGLYESNAQWE